MIPAGDGVLPQGTAVTLQELAGSVLSARSEYGVKPVLKEGWRSAETGHNLRPWPPP